jgi:hypothetical protein
MYKIIGADQKEYGPISSEQIRLWITEGRVNGQTQVLAEGTTEWKPLAAFPEFATALGLTPGVPPLAAFPTGGGIAGPQPADSIKGPAIGLIVTASLDLLLGLLGMLRRSAAIERYSNMPQFHDPQMQKMLHFFSGPVGFVSSIFQLLVALVILFGAIRMLSLKNYTLAFIASILAVIPCITPCCGLFTLAFGIWALVVLNKPAVKASFRDV